MSGVSIVTGESVDVVTTAQIKSNLRIASSDSTHDTQIEICRDASISVAKEYLQKSLMNRTLKLSLDNIPFADSILPDKEGITTGPFLEYRQRSVNLPFSPLVSVSSVKTFDDSDNATTMASSRYYVDTSSEYGRVILRTGETWDDMLRVGNAIEITYVAGYGTITTSVPAGIRQGIIVLASHYFENPEMVIKGQNTSVIPTLVDSLWKPFRNMRFGIGLG
jgi:hypothetical protein